MDNITKVARSRVMASVKSQNNKSTERVFLGFLKKLGLKGWRRKFKLKGKPDFVFPKDRIAIFIDGCFWHGCKDHCRMPSSNLDYWEQKIQKNKIRDRQIRLELRQNNWHVIGIWEHELKDKKINRKLNLICKLTTKTQKEQHA